jgi:hypothetical protein
VRGPRIGCAEDLSARARHPIVYSFARGQCIMAGHSESTEVRSAVRKAVGLCGIFLLLLLLWILRLVHTNLGKLPFLR